MTWKKKRGFVAFAAALSSSACGSHDGGESTAAEGDTFAVMTRVASGPDSVTGLLYLVPSLEQKGLVNDDDAYELSGGGLLAPIEGESSFLYLSASEPTMTRFDVKSGKLKEGMTLSAANLGATQLNFLAQTAPDLIWLEAYPTLSIVPFNPQSSELGDPIELSEVYDETYPDSYLGQAVERDGKLFIPVYHVEFAEGAAEPGTTFVVFDTKDRSYEIIRDDRCDWGTPVKLGDDIVVATTSALGASSFLLGREGFKAPCLLRIVSGDVAFDSKWTKPFSTWTGDAVAAELIPASDTRAYTRVFDSTLGPAEPVYYWDFAYADAWRWGVINPSDDKAVEVLDEAPAYGRVDQSRINGETWTFEYADANARSQVAALRPDGIVRGASFAGFIDGIVAVDGH